MDASAAPQATHKPRGKYRDTSAPDAKDDEDPATFLARILEYLETPQCVPPHVVSSPPPELTTRPHRYLRKSLFPLHPSLRLAGLLPPLDCPHHLRRDDDSPFREGVIVANATSDNSAHKRGADPDLVLVDVGGWDPIEASGGTDAALGTRVTVRMPSDASPLGASCFSRVH